MRNSLLEIAEYISLAGSVIGTAVSMVSQQAIFAAAPVSVSLLLNLANRRKLLEELTPTDANGAPVMVRGELSQEVEALRASVRQLPTQKDLNGVKQALQEELQRIERLEMQQAAGGEGALSNLYAQYSNLLDAVAALNVRLENVPPASKVEDLETTLGKATAGLTQLQRELQQMQTSLQTLAKQPVNVLADIGSTDTQMAVLPESAYASLEAQLQQLRNILADVRNDTENRVPREDFLSLAEATKVLEQAVTPITGTVAQIRTQLEALTAQVNRQSGEVVQTTTLQQLEEIRNGLEHLNRRIDSQSSDEVKIQELETAMAGLMERLAEITAGEPGLLEVKAAVPSWQSQIDDLTAAVAALERDSENQVVREDFLSLLATTKQLEQNLGPVEGAIAEIRTQLQELQAQPEREVSQGTVLAEISLEIEALKTAIATISHRIDDNNIDQISDSKVEESLTAIIQEELEALRQQINQVSELEILPENHLNQLDELRNAFTQLNTRLDNLPGAETVDLSGVENVLAKIADRVAEATALGEAVTNVVDAVADVRLQLEEVKSQLNLSGDFQPASIEQFQDLCGELVLINQRLRDLTIPEPVDLSGTEEVLEKIAESVAENREQFEQRIHALELAQQDQMPDQVSQLRTQYDILRETIAGMTAQLENGDGLSRLESVEAAVIQLQETLAVLSQEKLGELRQVSFSAIRPQETEEIASLPTNLNQLALEIALLKQGTETEITWAEIGKRTDQESPELKTQIESIVKQEFETQLGQLPGVIRGILSQEVQLVFDRPNIRAVLEQALDTAQNRVILVSPWLGRSGIDGDLLAKMEAFLQRKGEIDLGWGNLQDIDNGELPRRVNQTWQTSVSSRLYDGLHELEQLRKKYRHRLRFKILGTHENYVVWDSAGAMLTTHNFLSVGADFPEREVGIIASDPIMIKNLINRFHDPVLVPSNAAVYHKRGLERLHIGDYRGAIADYTRSLEVDSHNAKAYNDRGVAYFTVGDVVAAIEDYTHALQLHPQEAAFYFNRAFAFYQLGEYAASLEDYDQALSLMPEDAEGYFQRGEVCRLLKQYEKAEKDYTTALQFNPQDAVVYNNRGLVRYELNDLAGAIADYTSSLEINHQDPVTYFNRGIAYFANTEYKLAAQDFDVAISLKPNYSMAHYKRAFARLNMDDRDGAIEDLHMACELFVAKGDIPNYQKILEVIEKV